MRLAVRTENEALMNGIVVDLSPVVWLKQRTRTFFMAMESSRSVEFAGRSGDVTVIPIGFLRSAACCRQRAGAAGREMVRCWYRVLAAVVT